MENSSAVVNSNEAIKQRMFKAIDMQFYWIRCRIKQDQFIVYWNPIKDSLGDYTTKHHPPDHHIMVRPVYLHDPKVSTVTLQGCANSVISVHTACMLSPSFGNKTRTAHVLSPSYRNNARTKCMLSPPFDHITSPVGRYVRQSA